MSFIACTAAVPKPDCKCIYCRVMREEGLEPPILSEPDPKADTGSRLAPHGDPLFPLKASSATCLDATGQKVAPLPSATERAPAARGSTTQGATRPKNSAVGVLQRMLGADVPIITVAPTRSAKGYVYCVRRCDTRAIKIGFTTDITRRMVQLQSANDAELDLLFYFRATQRCEDRLLVQFQPWRKRGEWFRSSREVKAWIKEQSAVDGVIVQRKRRVATGGLHDIDGSYYCDECGGLVTGGLDYCPFCGEPQS